MSLRCIERAVINQFINEYFIETGTCGGDGITYALELGFKKIVSIDIIHDNVAHEKFKDNSNVNLITGDSGIALWEVIKNMSDRVTFWLDAHADLIKREGDWNPICPILEELQQIKKHPIKNHDILIDDITPIILLPGISKSILKSTILDINPNYNINYVDTGGTETLIATTRKNIDYGSHANSLAYSS